MQRGLKKDERQKLLLNLVNGSNISSQEQLVRLLNERGFSVTQASVSRDLEELRISKHGGSYRQQISTPATVFGEVSFEPAGTNLIVVKCHAGLASALAVRVDGARIPGIIGTVAGDDTVFVAIENASEQSKLISRLKEATS